MGVAPHDQLARLVRELDASPAIAWLKDLEGRYLYVNPSYVQQLKTSPERMCGRSDPELTAGETIDGPRLSGRGRTPDEPLQLEYTVAPFVDRPPLAVLRFAVTRPDGVPIGVCGVAAPLGDAELARSECARLMRAQEAPRAETARMEPAAAALPVREERRRIAALHPASATAARRPHELLTELLAEREQRERLERELAHARAEISELAAGGGGGGGAATASNAGAPEAASTSARSGAAVADPPLAPAPLPGSMAAPPPVSRPPRWNHRAQRDLAATLTTASDWHTGLRDAVRILGAHGNWDSVSVWVADERQPLLRCITIWTSGQDLREFETATWQRHLPIAGTQLGRALFGSGTIVVRDVVECDDERLRVAASRQMRAALLVPVRDGRSAVAALEMLTRSAEAFDEELPVAIDAVALQLAHFRRLLRLATVPRWRLGRL